MAVEISRAKKIALTVAGFSLLGSLSGALAYNNYKSQPVVDHSISMTGCGNYLPGDSTYRDRGVLWRSDDAVDKGALGVRKINIFAPDTSSRRVATISIYSPGKTPSGGDDLLDTSVSVRRSGDITTVSMPHHDMQGNLNMVDNLVFDAEKYNIIVSEFCTTP